MAGLEMTVVVKYFDKGVPGRAARGRGRLVQRYRPRRGTDCCVIAPLCKPLQRWSLGRISEDFTDQ